jgi:hypothetical protein
LLVTFATPSEADFFFEVVTEDLTTKGFVNGFSLDYQFIWFSKGQRIFRAGWLRFVL